LRTLVTTLVLSGLPRLALACPVCFGQNDSPLAKGVNMGVFFMLAVVAVMLGAFASFFVYLSRRARMLHGGAGHHAQSEGTAEC